MEEFKGTKGEWSYRLNASEGDKQSYYLLANEEHGWGTWVALVNSPYLIEGSREEAEANAKLIAAAPELLKAVQYLLNAKDNGRWDKPAAESFALDAINKALE